MYEHLETPEQIETFLAEQRQRLSDADWKRLVHQLADEMASRAENPAAELLQKIKVYKRATDQLELPSNLEPAVSPRAQARGWRVILGGRSGSDR